jgi:hypothetical protein
MSAGQNDTSTHLYTGKSTSVCCRSTPSALSLTSERAALIRQAFRLESMTVAWMVVEGVVALAAGLEAGSLTFVAFGLDSAIELPSAGVLIWPAFGRNAQEWGTF